MRVEEEDEETGNEEEEEDEEEEDGDEEEEEGDEVVELGDKGKGGKNSEKGKAPQKKRLPVPFFSEVHEREGRVEEGQASKKSRKEKEPEDDETKKVRRMNAVLEDYGTSVHHLARHGRLCLRGQPGSKTVLAAAPQMLFDCPNVVLRSSLSIRSDYLVAQKKCAETSSATWRSAIRGLCKFVLKLCEVISLDHLG